MSHDIVARLRVWSENAKEQDATEIVDGLCEAADEIERLRELSDDAERLRAEVERLRAELVKARRWICKLLANPTIAEGLASPCCGTPRDYAEEQDWDCFKGKTNAK